MPKKEKAAPSDIPPIKYSVSSSSCRRYIPMRLDQNYLQTFLESYSRWYLARHFQQQRTNRINNRVVFGDLIDTFGKWEIQQIPGYPVLITADQFTSNVSSSTLYFLYLAGNYFLSVSFIFCVYLHFNGSICLYR